MRSFIFGVVCVAALSSAALAQETPSIRRANDGNRLLVMEYVSITDSRLHIVDVRSGHRRLLAGGDSRPSSNFGLKFSADGRRVAKGRSAAASPYA